MVTHDPRAAAAADRVLFLADGRIVGDLAAPAEDRDHRRDARGDGPMIRVALKSLAARRAAHRADGARRRARRRHGERRVHDHRHDARRGRLAVAAPPTTAPTPSSPPARPSRWRRATGRRSGRPSTRACWSRCATSRAWPSPPATSRTRPRSSSATASRPATARTSASASTPVRRAPSGSRRSGSTPAAGPPARARSSSTPRRPRTRTTASARPCGSPRAASRTTSRSSASRRFGSVKSIGVATSAVFDLRDRAGAVRRAATRSTASSSPADEGVPAARLRERPRRGAAAGAGRHRRRAGPLHPRRARAVHLDHPDRAARVRRRGGARRRVHHLQHALDHGRPAHA